MSSVLSLVSCAYTTSSEDSRTGAQADRQAHAYSEWQVAGTSLLLQLKGTLRCDTVPVTGSFLACDLSLKDAAGEPVIARVYINGGMPAHKHGLPTSPVVEELDTMGQYRVKGLKFTMPGEWLLEFKIQNEHLDDSLLLQFNVNL